MSERVPIPVDHTKVGWRTDPGGNTITEPPAAKRADGYAYKEKVPHDELNWEMKLWGELLEWLRDFCPREWRELKDGIDNSTAPQRFVATRPDAGNLYRQYPIINQVTQSTYAPITVKTDGRRIYYIDANAAVEGQNVVAMDPEDGSQLWSVAKGYTQIVGLTCDGDRVYKSEQGANGVQVLNPATGAAIGAGGTQGELRNMTTNGWFLIGTYSQSLYFLNNLTGTIAETGSVSYGAGINATAIDNARAYIGGDAASNVLRAYDLLTRNLVWQTDPPTTSVPSVLALACDNLYLYVGIERTALTAGGFCNLLVYDRLRGNLIQAIDLDAAEYIFHLAVDQRFLYASAYYSTPAVHQELHTLDKHMGLHTATTPYSLTNRSTAHDRLVYACDGVSVIMVDLAPADPEIRRELMHPAPVMFQRCLATDYNREPFYNCAIPLEW